LLNNKKCGVMKKEEKGKEVKMNAGNSSDKKLSYEELEQLAANLNKQCQQFYSQLQEANRVISEINEVEILLSILGKSEHFSSTFTERCASKVETIINTALDAADKKEEKPAQ
jgi:hypothetical protein